MKELKFLSLVMVAVAAALLTACTSESENGPSNNISYESIKAAEQVPVTFGTYMGETPITRAGTAGSIQDYTDYDPSTDGNQPKTAEQVLADKGGFGVFAYYKAGGNYPETVGPPYVEQSTLEPNFMYNQLIDGGGSSATNPVAWTYSPIKYWPNDFSAGDVDNQDTNGDNAAHGSQASTVSFFAYAPYVTVTPSTGVPTGSTTVGITALTNYSGTSDPKVHYTSATNSNESVDLMWGVAPNSTAYTITPYDGVGSGQATQAVTKGLPNKNLTKQITGEKVDFEFNHALARLGLVVQAARDQVGAGPTGGGDPELWEDGVSAHKTRIYVNSVSITTNLRTSGILNLNNETPNVAKWESLSSPASTTLTINTASSNINPNLVYDSGIALDHANQKVGVLAKSETTLMQSGGLDVYYMLIPQTTGTIDVTINYDVKTLDAKLNGGMSTVNNVITKQISALALDNGKAYTLKLILGMTSVKIDASVADWDDSVGTTTVNLPINVN